MKKRKGKFDFLRYSVFLVIFVFFIYKVFALFGSLGEKENLHIVEYGSIVQENEYDCLIIRNEVLIFPERQGDVQYLVNEGDKVRKNYRLFQIADGKPDENGQPVPVDIKTSGGFMKATYENLDIQRQVEDIRGFCMDGAYEKVMLIEEAMADKISQAGMQPEKSEPVQRFSGKFSPVSGIVSFYMDGFEEILDVDSVGELDMIRIREEAMNPRLIKSDSAKPETPILKIIDNTVWYVYVYTDLRNIGRFTEGSNVKVVFADDEVNAKVMESHNEIGNCYALLRINEQAKAMSEKRKSRLNIVNQNIEGLILPTNSLVYQGEQVGVLVKDLNDKAIFKPVEIKGKNNDWTIVSDRVFYRDLGQGNLEAVDTVKLYDEIIVDISG